MGPFPVARPKVFEALSKLVSAKRKMALSSLVEAAVNGAKVHLPGPQPWEAIRHVTQNQLLKAQVARDESNRPLPDHWTSGKRIVHSLSDRWRVRVVGEILLALFESENVTGHDVANVCRSVWGSAGGESQAEFHEVMEYLTEEVRVVSEDKGGVFRVKRQQAPELAPVPASGRAERTASIAEGIQAEDESPDLVQ